MSIAILTVPLNYNYGGYLQAYALATVVSELSGEKTLILNRNMTPPALTRRLTHTVKAAVKRIIGRSCEPLSLSALARYKRHGVTPFADRHMPWLTAPIGSSSQLVDALRDNDVRLLIIGSDQVWRSIYVPDIEDYFGRAAHALGIPVITYAASFGNSAPDMTEEDCRNLSRIAAISVRETDAVDIINRHGCDIASGIEVVLDPTLLLTADRYMMLAEHAQGDGKAFCYTLDAQGNTPQLIDELRRLTPSGVHVTHLTQNFGRHTRPQYPTVGRWLGLIADAPFVLTDSYHGMLFSINMHREFAVIDNSCRGSSRFNSLLDLLDLRDRIIAGTDDLRRVHATPIDWTEVDRRLAPLCESSRRFLDDNIHRFVHPDSTRP